MRYSVYKALKVLSDSVLEGVKYVKNAPKSVNMLVDCVEAIMSIKNTLQLNNERVINELDEFVDIVYRISDCVEKSKGYTDELEKLYDNALIINEYCKKAVKYKFRIVFFAELGSKWDSMDSVYRAYKQREDCEVSVVLSPIFRAVKLPDGNIRSDIIYRDYLTPMGIPHIPFKDYDIKKDMPDMVFVSQPYESVTSEMFWAENIAPYTRLVYLPYYTTSSAANDDEIFVQCRMPIHKLAWRVVCQSESVKEFYSKYAYKAGENIIACGLPKWDWVVNMEDRDIQLPKEWEKLRDKKVILRNLHYNMEGSPPDIINAIRIIMEKCDGTEVAYIYRFHPMTETMFKVYYPQYSEEWESLKRDIKESKNAVIDENETYDCAFKFSDMLFTEGSSLTFQYLLTGKPAVICYWGSLEKCIEEQKNEKYFIKFSNLYVTDSVEDGDRIKTELLAGMDKEYEKRMEYIKEVMPNADGKIGERLSEQLIKEILQEDETE